MSELDPRLLQPRLLPRMTSISFSRGAGAPAHDTPPAVIAKLNAATNVALSREPTRTALAKLGAEPRGGSPQDLSDHLEREIAKWKPIVSTLNLKAD